jgi:hypothetical protein
LIEQIIELVAAFKEQGNVASKNLSTELKIPTGGGISAAGTETANGEASPISASAEEVRRIVHFLIWTHIGDIPEECCGASTASQS